jgi:sulfur-carrier protein
MAKLLYFAWVRERIGHGDDELLLPDSITTVGQLIDFLAARGGGYRDALAERDKIRIAVNQTYVGEAHVIHNHDEIALFPPVTGG